MIRQASFNIDKEGCLDYSTPITIFFKHRIAFLFYVLKDSLSDEFCSFWDAKSLASLIETILFAYTSKMTKREVFFVKKRFFFAVRSNNKIYSLKTAFFLVNYRRGKLD